jgi:hypothetical protein
MGAPLRQVDDIDMTSRRRSGGTVRGFRAFLPVTVRKDVVTVEGESPDSPTEIDPNWLALHAEREALERALTLAQAHQKFSSNPDAAAAARREEADLLVNLDRVLTLIRAAEYRRKPGARRW